MIFDLSAMVKAADPRTGRDTAYEFGNRVFLDNGPFYTDMSFAWGIGQWQIAAGPSLDNKSDTFVVAPGESGVGYEYVGDGTSTAWDVLQVGREITQSLPDWMKHDYLDWAQGTHA